MYNALQSPLYGGEAVYKVFFDKAEDSSIGHNDNNHNAEVPAELEEGEVPCEAPKMARHSFAAARSGARKDEVDEVEEGEVVEKNSEAPKPAYCFIIEGLVRAVKRRYASPLRGFACFS